MYVLGPCGPLQWTLLWGWGGRGWGSKCYTSIPTGFYSQRFWGFISLCWNPGLCSLFRSPVVPPSLSACKCGTAWSTSCHVTHPVLQPLPCRTFCLSLLPVWMNVSSFTPWFSDFHTVRFCGSSGYLLFLNLLLSFFWLCEEAKCIYLCLHLGQKSLECVISLFGLVRDTILYAIGLWSYYNFHHEPLLHKLMVKTHSVFEYNFCCLPLPPKNVTNTNILKMNSRKPFLYYIGIVLC